MKKSKIIGMVSFVAVAAAAGLFIKAGFIKTKGSPVEFRLVRLEKRDIIQRVSCSGELSAVVTVEVGSEISGMIKEISADYNSVVKKGEVIARLDPESYQTLVRQAEAEVSLAKAKLMTQKAAFERSQADLENTRSLLTAAQAQTAKARAVMENAKRDFERKQALVDQDFIARNEFDTAQTAYAEARAQLEQAKAQEEADVSKVLSGKAVLAMATAQIKEAEAQIQLKIAELDKRRVDLERTVIRSPVDGIVIDRSVDVGQTVAASLQAPTLFTIAQDLGKMQVSASVDEADIGRIRADQIARFTVDAFANRKFEGRVTQIRKAGKTIQNVVTYKVIISVENMDLSLMPGMTADVEIEILKKSQVLTVMNTALRYKPANEVQNREKNGSPSDRPSIQNGVQVGGAGGMNPEERVKKLSESLSLTSEQQECVRDIFKKTSEKLKTAKESGTVNPGAFRDQIRKETRSAIMKILTPEQKECYEQLAAGKDSDGFQKGVLWKLDEARNPVSVQIMTGISDGTHTEIKGTGVEEGMEVIAGVR
ncbi:MAG: efflux RND transporter periplasmic adaptor subunit [Thermodesulfobacteriota bacterium]